MKASIQFSVLRHGLSTWFGRVGLVAGLVFGVVATVGGVSTGWLLREYEHQKDSVFPEPYPEVDPAPDIVP